MLGLFLAKMCYRSILYQLCYNRRYLAVGDCR